MGKKYTDILKSLTHWDIRPPAYLFKQIWQTITGAQNSDVPVFAFANFADSSNDENTNEGYSATEIDIFRSLQNHSIPPPSFSSLKLGELIAEKEKSSTGKKASILNLSNFARAAAAVLIIAVGIWFIYNKKGDTNNIVATNTNTTNNVNTGTSQTQIALPSQPANTVPGNHGLMAITSKNNVIVEHGKKIKASQHLKESGGLMDNDILLTLVSYNYTEYLPLLAEIKKDHKITLDQYSYVSVSDKMNDVLQKMYATKGNNKPTRKAKKLRATMEKWKKRDEKHFDINTNNNPIDIIDLSEFILK